MPTSAMPATTMAANTKVEIQGGWADEPGVVIGVIRVRIRVDIRCGGHRWPHRLHRGGDDLAIGVRIGRRGWPVHRASAQCQQGRGRNQRKGKAFRRAFDGLVHVLLEPPCRSEFGERGVCYNFGCFDAFGTDTLATAFLAATLLTAIVVWGGGVFLPGAFLATTGGLA